MTGRPPVALLYSLDDRTLTVTAPADRDVTVVFYDGSGAYLHRDLILAGEQKILTVRAAFFALTGAY